MRRAHRFQRETKKNGQTLVEYALSLAIVAIVVIASMLGLGRSLSNTIDAANQGFHGSGGQAEGNSIPGVGQEGAPGRGRGIGQGGSQDDAPGGGVKGGGRGKKAG